MGHLLLCLLLLIRGARAAPGWETRTLTPFGLVSFHPGPVMPGLLEPGSESRQASRGSDLPARSRSPRRGERLRLRRGRRLAEVQSHRADPLRAQLSFLEAAAVRPDTRKHYERSLRSLLDWANLRTLPTWEPGLWDELALEYLESLFLEGFGPSLAGRVLSALAWAVPGLPRPLRLGLPRAHRALQGWKRHAPGHSRPPLPWLVVAGLASVLLEGKLPLMGVAIILMFGCYLRPSEALLLRASQLLPPEAAVGGWAGTCWGVVLCAAEYGRASKTNEFDDSVVLEMPEARCIEGALHHLKERRSPHTGLWGFSYEDLRHAFNTAAERLKITHLKPTLYALRHGGASHDAAVHKKPLADIAKKGRWRSHLTVRRYEKHGRLALELGKVRGEALRSLRARETSLPQKLGELFGWRSGTTTWAGSASSWRSSQEARGCQSSFANRATLAWPGTPSTAPPMTSCGRSTWESCGAGSSADSSGGSGWPPLAPRSAWPTGGREEAGLFAHVSFR